LKPDLPVGLARSYCSHDTESQNHKNDEAYDNVEAIALEIKAQRCERYARDRCCDEKDESELDDGIGPQAHRGSDYPGQSSQTTSLQVKCCVNVKARRLTVDCGRPTVAVVCEGMNELCRCVIPLLALMQGGDWSLDICVSQPLNYIDIRT